MEKWFPVERVVTKFQRPFLENVKVALSKPLSGVEEPPLGYLKTRYLKYLPDIERNVLLTGDTDQEFDPFQHIIQFENNFDPEQNIPLVQQDQKRRRKLEQNWTKHDGYILV